MMKAIKKGLAAAALLAVGAAAAPESAAYKQVCMKAEYSYGFTHKYRVLWGTGDGFAAAGEEGPDYADGVTDWSEDIHLGEKKCVSLSAVPTGAHFAVQMPMPPSMRFCHGWGYAIGKDKVGIFSKRPEDAEKTLVLDAWEGSCIPSRVEE